MSRVDPRFESPVDRTIREAVERGDFDDLPGRGKPLPGAGTTGPIDENWWIRGYLEREGVSADALLPPSIQLRKELDGIDATVARFTDERRVRERVGEVNSRVVDHMRHPMGPRVPVRKLDADEVVSRWRAAREQRRPRSPGASTSPQRTPRPPAERPHRSWWARLLRARR